MILTGQCKSKFLKDHPFWIILLPKKYLHLLILRWFNRRTYLWVDFQHWDEDGYDYAYGIKGSPKVYISKHKAGERLNNFDRILKELIIQTQKKYNDLI